MIKYEWQFPTLECASKLDGKTDVVLTIHWRHIGRKETPEKTFGGSVYGTTSINYTPSDNFTPYENLQKDQVEQWVKDALGEKIISKQIDDIARQIDEQENPSIIPLPPPWQKP